jgi:hypothetical protein
VGIATRAGLIQFCAPAKRSTTGLRRSRGHEHEAARSPFAIDPRLGFGGERSQALSAARLAMASQATVTQSRFTADADKEPLGRVVTCGESFERGIGREFKERCEKFYRQYRSFSRLRSAWIQGSENDRDGLLYDAKRDWGAQLAHTPELPHHRDDRARPPSASARGCSTSRAASSGPRTSPTSAS